VNDQEIIKRIRAGNKEAYGELIYEFHNKVMGYCLSMLSNRTDAEEATQDIFVKAYCALDRFNGNSTFSTWIYRITTNHCIDILRMKNRRKTGSLDALMEAKGFQIESLFATDEGKSIELENRELIEKTFSTLPLRYRTILTLHELNGLEIGEIAVILGCSRDAVKSRLARARKNFMVNYGQFLERGSVNTEKRKNGNSETRRLIIQAKESKEALPALFDEASPPRLGNQTLFGYMNEASVLLPVSVA
jgi:RNA polymerase sigma-70 factor (ECF subfamily)